MKKNKNIGIEVKRALCILLCAVALSSSAFAISVKNASQVNAFDSIPMLEAYYNPSMEGANEEFWGSCKISLVTIGEGSPLYSWFGHSALLVEAPGYSAYVYDYGTFSFDEDGFYKNFAMGRLWFCCNVSYATYELAYLETTGRTYHLVELQLNASQKKAIINFLNVNATEEHRTYLYNHYTDNCATRLRDIINYATDGDFEAWATGIEGRTFRQIASSALSKNRPVQWVLEFLQSGQIDGSATLWDEMFLPSILEQAVIQYGLQSGLIQPDTSGYTPSDVEPNSNILFSVLTGLALGLMALILILWSNSSSQTRYNRLARGLYKGFTFTVNLIFGLLGTLLMFMMFFTNHNVTWYNENLLFINPILIVMAIMSLQRKPKGLNTLYKILLGIMGVLVALKLVLPKVFLQDNWCTFAMIAPYYVVNAFGCFFSKIYAKIYAKLAENRRK